MGPAMANPARLRGPSRWDTFEGMDRNDGTLVETASCITVRQPHHAQPLPFGLLLAAVLAVAVIAFAALRIRRFLKNRRTRSRGP